MPRFLSRGLFFSFRGSLKSLFSLGGLLILFLNAFYFQNRPFYGVRKTHNLNAKSPATILPGSVLCITLLFNPLT